MHARLGSLETQLYALFIFVLLISLVVLISFFFVLRSERTQVQVLHNRITQLEELLEGVQHDAKCSKALIPQAEYGKDAPLLKEQDLQRLDSLVTQLNEVASSLYSQLSLSKGTKES